MFLRWPKYKIVSWKMLDDCRLTFTLVDATLFLSESWCAFQPTPIKNVTREFKKAFFSNENYFSRFNGFSFKSERSSKFSHKWIYALGSYRKSPFITGHFSMNSPPTNGLKTEILIYRAEKSSSWIQAADYPFSNGNR